VPSPSLRGALLALAPLFACGGSGSPTATVHEECPQPEYVPVPAVAWPCPPAAEVAAIRSDVEIVIEVDPTAGTLVCTAAEGSADLTRLEERVLQALWLMKRLRFDAPLPWTSRELYPWFVDAVEGVRFRETAYSFCCDPPGVINLAVHPDRNPSYGESFPTLIEGLVHEARHADGPRHSCGVSDRTLDEMGAWGAQYSLDLWMGRHEAGGVLTPEEREYCVSRAAFIAALDFCTECPGVD